MPMRCGCEAMIRSDTRSKTTRYVKQVVWRDVIVATASERYCIRRAALLDMLCKVEEPFWFQKNVIWDWFNTLGQRVKFKQAFSKVGGPRQERPVDPRPVRYSGETQASHSSEADNADSVV